ncbi:MAG TPA: hypothetical protein V6C78_13680 [Crinalium sp.]|jgi:hypothetical protein
MKLHRYVIGLIGVMALFAISYPIAFMRVAQNQKFAGSYLKSLTLEGTATQASSSRP